MRSDEPLVLGIETSCDETGVGIVRGQTLLANAVASSMAEHVRFGGVVPEIASRAHLEAMAPTMRQALDHAGVKLSDVDAIAVTAGPGLAGALMVGLAAAKTYAAAIDKPLYGINHLCAHVAVDVVEHGPIPGPTIALLVSGGHSCLFKIDDFARGVISLGSTLDDAPGEAYDKVARLLGLGYPGGPVIDRAARDGSPTSVSFPRALTAPRDRERHRFDFSFSGLKTAVTRYLHAQQSAGEPLALADVTASFQEAVADVLTAKAVDACQAHDVSTLIIAGGVAANSRLRSLAAQRCEEVGITLRVPRPGLCTDNGAMVAALGAHLVAAGFHRRRGTSPPTPRFPSRKCGCELIVIVRMWEAFAHPEAHQDLVTWICDVGIPELEHEMSHLNSEVFTSTDHRVVVVSRWRSEPRDPSPPPPFYLRRPPQSWDFSPVDR